MPSNLLNLAGSELLELIGSATNVDFNELSSSDFDLNSDQKPKFTNYRPAAVMVPLVLRGDSVHVMLTKRAAHLKHHPGQISFPGGKVDPSDKDAKAAADRETFEEIGLPLGTASHLGTLPIHRTVTGFQVQPIIAKLPADFNPVIDPGEVEETFTVPLLHVLKKENFLVEGRIWMGSKRRYYVVPYGPYYIWGATARMLRMFADRVEQAYEAAN